MSAQAGWYPDPGGGQGLYRYWDGRAWSAATSPHANAAPPHVGLVGPPQPPSQQPYGQGAQQPYGQQGTAYANYQQATQKRRGPVGWWIAAAALVAVIAVVGVLAVRAIGNNVGSTGTGPIAGQPSDPVCPPQQSTSVDPAPDPGDGRVHGGPISFPRLGSPWSAPYTDDRVPFATDVLQQSVTVEANYADDGNSWVASVLVAELQAGDGFYTPEQGADIVVRCVLGRFYSNAEVRSDVQVDQAATIDGKQGWIVESQLSFDIPDLETKGELLIVAIVPAGTGAGLFYASIPDTRPELVQPARDALRQLQVDG